MVTESEPDCMSIRNPTYSMPSSHTLSIKHLAVTIETFSVMGQADRIADTVHRFACVGKKTNKGARGQDRLPVQCEMMLGFFTLLPDAN